MRIGNHLSLQQLAERAGVSGAAIHKIEHGQMTPSITVLMKIADALGKRVTYFLGEERRDDFYFVRGVEMAPRDERRRIEYSGGSVELERLAFRLERGQIHSGIYRCKSGVKSGSRPHSHPGEELVFQLEGMVEYTIRGEVFVLRPGDCLHFRSELPHTWRLLGDQDSAALVVLTPPPYDAAELSEARRDIY
ncbi:MAG: XRE family transcriptional regulator [Proteobacteria bacterium]|nr:XRE family transcriptional regulator [Pseudomonadota bacterium]